MKSSRRKYRVVAKESDTARGVLQIGQAISGTHIMGVVRNNAGDRDSFRLVYGSAVRVISNGFGYRHRRDGMARRRYREEANEE